MQIPAPCRRGKQTVLDAIVYSSSERSESGLEQFRCFRVKARLMLTAIVIVVVILFVLNLKEKFVDWGIDQARRDARAGRSLRNFGVLIVGVIIVAAFANPGGNDSIKLKGNVGHTLNWPLVELRADRVAYSGDSPTQAMRIALYAAPEAFHGGSTASWRSVAAYEMRT
jgi:hypothetical protein